MNNGLPSLLDAIFGKKDLSGISVEEISDVIREFPSFNAGHFLLAKKLKLQNDTAYDKESMRTALYFNNPFWLQSLLDDGDHIQPADIFSHAKKTEEHERLAVHASESQTVEEVDADIDFSILEETNYTFESYTPVEKPIPPEDELDEEVKEILDEKPDQVPVTSTDTFQNTASGLETVTSFDELMAKYHLQPLDMVDETPVQISSVESETDINFEPVTDSSREISDIPETTHEANEQEQFHEDASQPTSKEVINEYGIFEETDVEKTDHEHDLDAFDRPFDQIPFVSEKLYEETIPDGQSVHSDTIVPAGDIAVVDTGTVEILTENDNATIVENQETTDLPHKTDQHDYDAFDRRTQESEHIDSIKENEDFVESSDYDPDNTGEPVEYSDESENGANTGMNDLSQRFEEQQKVLSAFNAKNADSIVFTPYHMVDYFASQGIKLVMEDNPPDQFSRQLKSFTDWLKVMKKLPQQASAANVNEKETEEIRQYAAHSIEERNIVTESMAEVLAKQGMYENAIALFQKLSLLYPPKSAYFATRIEQLKAALP